jgi:hypothetical protein
VVNGVKVPNGLEHRNPRAFRRRGAEHLHKTSPDKTSSTDAAEPLTHAWRALVMTALPSLLPEILPQG